MRKYQVRKVLYGSGHTTIYEFDDRIEACGFFKGCRPRWEYYYVFAEQLEDGTVEILETKSH